MAERRMFAKAIVLSDAFLDMPVGARCLYMTMGMVADDDGFVNSPRAIMRQTGASDDDMRVLIAKKFVIPFDSGVIVIKHWRINNYLRNDRYQETTYIDEKSQLIVDENKAYKKANDVGIPPLVYPGKDSIEKNSIGKNSIGEYREAKESSTLVPPAFSDVEAYARENNVAVDVAKKFYAYFEGKDWKDIYGNKVKDWKKKLDEWVTRENSRPAYSRKGKPDFVPEPIEELTSEARADLISQMFADGEEEKAWKGNQRSRTTSTR